MLMAIPVDGSRYLRKDMIPPAESGLLVRSAMVVAVSVVACTYMFLFTDELIDSRGKLSVPIPKGLQNGRYLLRAEFIALHEANGKYSKLAF